MTRREFEGRANHAARELLAAFCQKCAEEARAKPQGFHESHVQAAAEVIVRWLWEEQEDRP